MNFALDILLVVIIAIFVVVGVRRGFIKSAVRFLGAVVSALLASIFGSMAAQWLYNTLFHAALVEKISNTIIMADGVQAVQKVLNSLPDFIVRALESAGITEASLAGNIAGQSDRIASVLASALEPVFVSFLKVLTVTGFFLLLMVLVRVLANVVSAAFELPLLDQVNGLLGGVFGLFMALLVIWVVLGALQVFLPMLASDAQAQVQEWLDSSVLTGFIVGLNPLGAMFR